MGDDSTLIVGTAEEPKIPEVGVVSVFDLGVDPCGLVVPRDVRPKVKDCPKTPSSLGVGVPKGEPNGVVETAAEPNPVDMNA